MTDRLAISAHSHGHDGLLMFVGYSFAEITLGISLFTPALQGLMQDTVQRTTNRE